MNWIGRYRSKPPRYAPLALAVYGILAVLTNAPLLAADDDELSVRLGACQVCHGERGRATPDGFFPRIAGKPHLYLFNQLKQFRDGRRHNSAMQHLLAVQDDRALSRLAQQFADQQLPYPPPAPATGISADALANGKKLALQGLPERQLPSCASCHGRNLMGDGQSVPPLLGLPRDYLTAQLGAWRNGTRTSAGDCMADIAGQLRTSELVAVSAWLASQPIRSTRADPTGKRTDRHCASFETDLIIAAEPALDQTRGAYLAQAANCAGCHLGTQGQPYAGGRPIQTPFGKVYASNLTPDLQTGLGQWTADDFWRAMHHGQSRDSRWLYPAFPYPQYSAMTRADSDAIFAYLRSLQPIQMTVPPAQLTTGFSWPVWLRLWRWLYFRPSSFKTDPAQSAIHNRGRYLVQVLGHCGACHDTRNSLGAMASNGELSGQMMPNGRWYAPSLLHRDQGGLQAMSVKQIVQWLRGEQTAPASTGPMAQVIHDSTARLNDADLHAMASYLQTLPDRTATDSSPAANPGKAGSAPANTAGARIYEEHCKDCHGQDGHGQGGVRSLAGNRQVSADIATNLITTVLDGGYGPATRANPYPLGMPPFKQILTNSEIAQVLTYIRQAWRNQAPAVSTAAVRQHR